MPSLVSTMEGIPNSGSTNAWLGRRNLTDDQRADIANEVREIRSEIERKETRAATVAKEVKLPKRKIRLAQEIKRVDPAVSAMVRAGRHIP
jgi:hypothetical protein